MRYLNWIFLTTLCMGLTACTSNKGMDYDSSVAYKTANNSVPQVAMTSDLNAERMQNDYAVPPTIDVAGGPQDPSLVPPGSNLQVANNAIPVQPMPAEAQPMMAPAAPPIPRNSSVAGNQLTINKNLKQTWAETGKVLTRSGYPIVEQDASLSTYYVADKVGSGGSIKRDTPIYQVQLQPGDQGTVILLMNSQNQPASSSVSNRILGTLREKLN